jgi:hypothetical protein
MRRTFLALAFALLSVPAWAQFSPQQTPAPAVSGAPVNRSTVNTAVVITTGNTFQTILAARGSTTQRQAITIENNNASDSCWLFIGSGTATKATSILLLPGGSYTRYWPFVPSDAFQATCTTTNDTMYLDNQ